MQTALRPYTTAGVALLGAGVIAIPPIAPRMPDITDIERALPVHLTAAVDPITQWTDVLNQANANFTTIANNFLAKPFPVLQQVIANQIGYLGELPDAGAIAGQIQHNLQAAAAAPIAQDQTTLDALHQVAFALLPTLVPGLANPSFKPLLDFLTTSLSGALLGLVLRAGRSRSP